MLNCNYTLLSLFIVTMSYLIFLNKNGPKIIFIAILINISLYTLIILNFNNSISTYSLIIFLLLFSCLDLLIFFIYNFNKFAIKNLKSI